MKRFLAIAASYGLNRLVVTASLLVPSLFGASLTDLGHIELLLASVSIAWSLGPLGADGVTHVDFIDRKADWHKAIVLSAVGGGLFALAFQSATSSRWLLLATAIGSLGAVQKLTQARLRVDRSTGPLLWAAGVMILTYAGVGWLASLTEIDRSEVTPIALMAAMGAFAVVGLVSVQRQLFVDGSRFRELIRFGFPLAIAGLFTEVIAVADRFLIQWFMGTEAVGLYGVTYRWVALFGAAGAAVATYWNAEAFRRGGHWARTVARKHLRLWIVGIVTICLAGWYPMAWLTASTLDLGIGDVDFEVLWLLLGVAGFVLGTQLVSVLAAGRKSMPGARAKAAGAGLNIGLNIVLIPFFGLSGAAFSTALAQAIVAFIAWVYVRREWDLDDTRPADEARTTF